MEIFETDEQVEQARQDGIPLVDVRPREQFEQGHIPGAVNIPWDEIDQNSVQPGSYIYCRSGRKSGFAKEILAQQGIAVTNIGGMEYYTGPVEKTNRD